MKLTEEQQFEIIKAVYNYTGDEYDMDECGNAAFKFDSQDLKLLNRIDSIVSSLPAPTQDGTAEEVLKKYDYRLIDADGKSIHVIEYSAHSRYRIFRCYPKP